MRIPEREGATALIDEEGLSERLRHNLQSMSSGTQKSCDLGSTHRMRHTPSTSSLSSRKQQETEQAELLRGDVVACDGRLDSVSKQPLQTAGNDDDQQLKKCGNTASVSCACLTQNTKWLLQAAEAVFTPFSTPPDVLTEEPVGERRPLLLAALTWAIETEKAIFEGHPEKNEEAPIFLSRRESGLEQQWRTAFDLVRFLLARGASLRVPSEAGVLPLEFAIKNHSLRATALLLAAPQCYSAEREDLFPLRDRLTPLHLAAAENDLSLAALLLTKPCGGKLRQSSRCRECGSTAVAFSHTVEVPKGLSTSPAVSVELPLCRHCLANSRDTRGCTPAFYSCSHTMLRVLLDNGASPDSTSSNGDTLLHALVYNARRILSRNMVNKSSLLKSSESANDSVCSNCHCNECSDEDLPGVSAICRIILLLKRTSRASVSGGSSRERHAAPYHELCTKPEETAPLVDKRNAAGWTPLHLAASRGYLDVCTVLLDFGADPALRTKKKSLLAADLALRRKHWSTSKTLRRAADATRPLSAIGILRRLRRPLQHSSQNHPLLFVLILSVLGLICLDWQGVAAALQIYFPQVFGPLK
ncbi:hypothetical protein Esti_001057 [Eimeria stiedai]